MLAVRSRPTEKSLIHPIDCARCRPPKTSGPSLRLPTGASLGRGYLDVLLSAHRATLVSKFLQNFTLMKRRARVREGNWIRQHVGSHRHRDQNLKNFHGAGFSGFARAGRPIGIGNRSLQASCVPGPRYPLSEAPKKSAPTRLATGRGSLGRGYSFMYLGVVARGGL